MKKKLLLLSILLFITIITTGCDIFGLEDKRITNNALKYFSKKYNIDKSKIKITSDGLYGKNRICIDSCGENEMHILYNSKKYIITYNPDINTYGDNYQYKIIKKDLEKYVRKKFSFVHYYEIDGFLEYDVFETPIKYNGNIKKYFLDVNNFLNTHKYIGGEDGEDVAYTLSTDIKLYIGATNELEAKNLNDKYANIVITELESLGVRYTFNISQSSFDDKDSSFYYYEIDGQNYFYFKDNVNNHEMNCKRRKVKKASCIE